MRRGYIPYNPKHDARQAIAYAQQICAEYAEQGYDVTLRQLYYRFVALNLFPEDRRWALAGNRWVRDPNGTKNATPNYDWLGTVLNKARLGGLLDWDYIVDRTRNLRSVSHWDHPIDIVHSAAESFRVDKWARQPYRIEVWVEKEALSGVVERVADRNDVAWFACRGYVSQSELRAAARRHLSYIEAGQGVVVLHLGDHDPSGIDMTRDIRERLEQFIEIDWMHDHGSEFMTDAEREQGGVQRWRIQDALREAAGGVDAIEVRRIALNMDQVREYDPPSDPAKFTDSRINGYVRRFGRESWELDALPPDVLAELIEDHIMGLRLHELYDEDESGETVSRRLLAQVAREWSRVVELVGGEE